MLSRMLSISAAGIGAADRLLDQIAEPRGLFDAGAGLGAHMEDERAAVRTGKKFCPRNGSSTKAQRQSSEEDRNKDLRAPTSRASNDD